MSDSAPTVPSDIPLPLPLPAPLLTALLILFFVVHILFVNLMLGGSLLSLVFELAGLRRPRFDAIAHEISKTITVTKSMAVVLGVGPLLGINLLYTIPFYAANRVTGKVWLLIVPMTIAAFLLTYLHKYAWERLREHKAIHITIGAMAVALFLSIPMIFLVNINLMLFPEKWRVVQEQGFLSGVLLDNVIPRYVHFILASIAGTGLFLVWYLTRPAFPLAERLPGETRHGLRRLFYTVALIASFIQLAAGPMVLLTLPAQGLSHLMIAHILAGAALAVMVMWWMWLEIAKPESAVGERLGAPFWRIVVCMGVVVLLMATGRHLYRAQALRSYQAQMAVQTIERQKLSAHYRANPSRPAEEDPLAVMLGYPVFKQSCMACHAVDTKLVGPPLTEIARLYGSAADDDAFIRFVRSGSGARVQRDRSVYPASMPPFSASQISDADLRLVAELIRRAGEP
jgi:cytochrome c